MCEHDEVIGFEEVFEDDGAFWYFLPSHLGDGVNGDDLVDDSFGEQALEGSEVVVDRNLGEWFPAVGVCSSEVGSEALAQVEVDVLHADGHGFLAEIGEEVVAHVPTGVGIAVSSVCPAAVLDVPFDVIDEPYLPHLGGGHDASFAICEFHNPPCLDDVGRSQGVGIGLLRLSIDFGDEVQSQKFIVSDTVVVSIKIN